MSINDSKSGRWFSQIICPELKNQPNQPSLIWFVLFIWSIRIKNFKVNQNWNK